MLNIFYTQYTLTIGQYEVIEITANKKLMNRTVLPIPKKWCEKAFSNMMQDYGKKNDRELLEFIEIEDNKLKYQYKFMKLEVLIELIKMQRVGKESKILDQLYFDYYKEKPKTEADWERPFKDFKHLLKKSKQMFPQEPKQEDKTPEEIEQEKQKERENIKKLIRNTETFLSNKKIRNEKLYLLKGFIEDANKAIPKK